MELTEFRSRHEELKAAGVGLAGVSADSVYSHEAFAEQLGGLPFELIADWERNMIAAYGVSRTDLKGYPGVPIRSVFIIDKEGVIRWTWIRTKEEPLPLTEVVVQKAKEIARGSATEVTT